MTSKHNFYAALKALLFSSLVTQYAIGSTDLITTRIATSDPSQPASNREIARVASFALLEVPGETAFQRLESLFLTGENLSVAELDGWNIGRSVEATNPNEVRGGLLVGVNVPMFPGGGPAFPERRALIPMSHPMPMTFDTMHRSTRDRIGQIIEQDYPNYETPFVDDGVLSFYSGSEGKRTTRWEVRRNGDFIVLRAWSLDSRAVIRIFYFFNTYTP